MPPRKEIVVLLVEDDPADVVLIEEAFRESGFETQLHHVPDGVEATDFLFRRGQHAEATRPDFVLLDLNLPRKSGLEVLREVKADPDLSDIPVVMLTTSSSDDDVRRAYRDHVNAFVTKPVDFDRFIEVVGSIDAFYVETAHLPRRPPGAG